jgi:GT2 family glycosyltransferase
MSDRPSPDRAGPEPEATPGASVIVVGYNGQQYLAQCLPSLLGGADRDYEVVFVDNASTDGSADYVQRTFPHVRVLRNETNLGFGGAANLGAREARGKYLAFLNQDTLVEPGWLTALTAALERDRQVGLVTSKILLLDRPDAINTCGNDVHCTGLALCRGMGQASNTCAELEEVQAVSGAAFAISKDLFHRLGEFDGTFFMYMEDTDLSWRARLAGHRCLYVPESVVYHDYALHFGPQKTFYQERNRYLILLKHLRWPTLFALLPALVLGEVVTWGFVLLRERQRLANKMRAYGWIVSRWRHILDSRRRVQALRRVRDRELIRPLAHRLDYGQTGEGPVARLAHVIFDPLFWLAHRLALAVVWW